MYIPMTKIFILSWQDIPTVIEARDYNGIEKVELSKRFSELVDLIAMKKGMVGMFYTYFIKNFFNFS